LGSRFKLLAPPFSALARSPRTRALLPRGRSERRSGRAARRSLEREVDADRFTRLDRMLIAEQRDREFMDLRPDPDMVDTFRQNRALLIGRARKLERLGLATEIDTGR
jgi:hypothetical protein